MKSVEDIQKLKVAELKVELQSRGLDTKGVKAVLMDRLVEAVTKEGGGVGNGTESLVKPAVSEDTAGETGEEDEGAGATEAETASVREGSPKRATRGQSVSPVKSATPIQHLSPRLSPSKEAPPSSPTKPTTPSLVASAIPVTDVETSPLPTRVLASELEKSPLQSEETESMDTSTSRSSPANEASGSLICNEAEKSVPEKVEVSRTETLSDGTEKTVTSSIQDNTAPHSEEPMEAESTVNKEQSEEASQGVMDDQEQEADEDKERDTEIVETGLTGKEDNNNDEGGIGMDSENMEEGLKRKREQVEEKGEDKPQVEKSTEQEQPKKPRLDHYNASRILPEDEPEFDEQKVLLDWYNSDLNIAISKENFLKASPVLHEDFPWAYAGTKATHGFTQGKLFYEVKLLDNLDVNIDLGELEAKYVLRIGWSDLHAGFQLGEELASYGIGNDGKFYNAGIVQDLEDTPTFEKGDIVATFLDLDTSPAEIKFSRNGVELPESIPIEKVDLEGKILFPHILTRNVSFEANFGESEPAHPLLEDFQFVNSVESTETNKIRGPKAPTQKSECEFVMLSGMACCGKTTWSKNHKAANPDKHYNIIGTSSVVERAVKKSTLSSENLPKVYESFNMKAGRFVEKLMELAPTRRRNYILDQSNVMPVVQRRKAAGFEGFKRKAVVVLPNDEEYQKRIQARDQEQGKSVPKSTLLDMKATFRLPEVGEIFSEVEFAELKKEECEELLKKYNKEGADAGYYGQKPSRGGWRGGPGFGGFRGSRGFRGGGPGGFRGPPPRGRGTGGYRGNPPPFRYMRGADARPQRYGGPSRVPRDFAQRSYGPPRGGRAGPPPMPLIPRRADAPRSAWIRGVPPMNGRGGGVPAPRAYHSAPPRQPYGGMRASYGGPPMAARPQQQAAPSVWATGQPGGWAQPAARSGGGFHHQAQQPDPWVQQVPDQGYGQSWGASGRGGGGAGAGGGTWQGYGGQTYGSYGRK